MEEGPWSRGVVLVPPEQEAHHACCPAAASPSATCKDTRLPRGAPSLHEPGQTSLSVCLSACQHLPLQRRGVVLLLARIRSVLGSPFSERFALSEGFSPRLTAGIYRLGVILPLRSMLFPSSLSHALATGMSPWDGPAEGEHVSCLIHITENILLLPVQASTAPHRRHQPNLPVQHLQEVLRAAAA